ncbi:helix-turn-helix transcriptional regulator [Bacillus thuringiensis]|uniref:helix-turn-helix transcriptional regulator n=1 Tax=Bacillus thuringiensis TaxID=1428 RepID=UPI000BF916DE|nr:hypothetical protein [Bacillus thuringiensis]PFE66065.1 hypothetical protein CN322_03090 [Bacillus thuringiensis]
MILTIEDLRGKTVEEAMQLGADITSPAQKEARKNKPKKHYEGNTQFVMVKKGYDEVDKLLSLEQSGIMMFLLGFAKLGGQGTLYVEQGDNKATEKLTVSKLGDLLGKSPAQVKRILGELEKLSLIVRIKEGRNTVISLGEQFFNVGKMDNKQKFTKVFKTALISLASDLSFSELGLFMKLTSNFHFEYQLLCDNPHETDKSKVQLWSRKHIAEYTGVSEKTVKRILPQLFKKRAIIEITTSKKALLMHPRLVSKTLKSYTLEEVLIVIEKASFSRDNFKN